MGAAGPTPSPRQPPRGYGADTAGELTSGEASTWRLVQRLSDLATGVVEHQIRSAADLSSAGFDVLRCLVDAADRQLRQNELAALLGRDTSRLSHQLTRMQHREVLDRQKPGRVHAIAVTRTGVQKYELADNAHVAAVRSLLREHLSAAEREALERTAAAEVHPAAAEPATSPPPPPPRPHDVRPPPAGAGDLLPGFGCRFQHTSSVPAVISGEFRCRNRPTLPDGTRRRTTKRV